MLEKNTHEWCIVRWHDGEVLVRKKYQWEAQAKHYLHKWEYIAKKLTERQAIEYSKLFKE
jgi:hypothetical protein